MKMGLVSCLLLLHVFASNALASVLREDIGELSIHDLLLRPNFTLKEPSQGAFSIGESSFALRWELEKKYAGIVRIGSKSLLNPSARYTATVEDKVMLVEAFGDLNAGYGRVRFGRLPVEFGYEGRLWERDLIFPRSLLFRQRAMMLRDTGVSYDISYNNWYTGFVVHNGESEQDTDGRIWYTARWGYKTDKFEIGWVGQTGSTKVAATELSADTLAGVDPLLNAQWRVGGLNTRISQKKFEWVMELYGGEREQVTEVGKFATGHTDVSYDFLKTFSAHLRYDFFDANVRKDANLVQQVSLALVLSNPTHSSNLILVGTKVLEEGTQIGNDEIRLIWNLSPSGIVRF